jgi:U3 small nucleolar RNA-associated protein 22
MARHLPPGTHVDCTAGSLDFALQRRGSSPDADMDAVRACEAAAERLGKQLRSVGGGEQELPLRIVTVQPLAATLRHAAVFPPLPHQLAGAAAADAGRAERDQVPRCLEPVELLCGLEGSGRWPDDPEAHAKTKAAVGVQLAHLLQSSFGLDAQGVCVQREERGSGVELRDDCNVGQASSPHFCPEVPALKWL